MLPMYATWGVGLLAGALLLALVWAAVSSRFENTESSLVTCLALGGIGYLGVACSVFFKNGRYIVDALVTPLNWLFGSFGMAPFILAVALTFIPVGFVLWSAERALSSFKPRPAYRRRVIRFGVFLMASGYFFVLMEGLK